MALTAYIVGQKICEPSADKVQIDFSDDGFTLLVKYRSPNASEKRDYRSGVAQFKLAIENDIIFFLARFGTQPWLDTPYARSLSGNLTSFMRQVKGYGYPLHLMFIDAATGILLSQRVIGLTTEFSNVLFDAIAQQPELTQVENNLRVEQVYQRFSTTDLVARAIATN